jgi:hypothetical protein
MCTLYARRPFVTMYELRAYITPLSHSVSISACCHWTQIYVRNCDILKIHFKQIQYFYLLRMAGDKGKKGRGEESRHERNYYCFI